MSGQKWLRRFEVCVGISVFFVIVFSSIYVSVGVIGDAYNYEPMKNKNTPPVITKIDGDNKD